MPKKNLNFSTRFVRAMGNLYITACHLQMDIQKIVTAASYELRTKYQKCTYIHAGIFFFSTFFSMFLHKEYLWKCHDPFFDSML